MNRVFISFKNSYEGKLTPDSEIALCLCRALRERGLTVFFSNTALREVGADRYMDKIEGEIASADAMVVVGTRSEYVSQGWVRQEWMTFLNLLLSSDGKSLYTFAPGPCDVSSFPAFLQPFQSFKTEDEAVTFIVNKFLLQDEMGSASEADPASLTSFWSRYFGLFCPYDREGALDSLPSVSLPDGLADALLGAHIMGKKDVSRGEALLKSSVRKRSVAGAYFLAHSYITGATGMRQLSAAKAILSDGYDFFTEQRIPGARILFLIWSSRKRLSRAFYCADIFKSILDAYGIGADFAVYDGALRFLGVCYDDIVFILNEDSFSTDEEFLSNVVKYDGSSIFMLNGFTTDAVPRKIRRRTTYACEDADIESIGRYLKTKYASEQ